MPSLEIASKDEDLPFGQRINLRRRYAARKRACVPTATPVQFFLCIDILLHNRLNKNDASPMTNSTAKTIEKARPKIHITLPTTLIVLLSSFRPLF